VDARGAHFTYAVGRLRDGVTLEQARSEVSTIAAELAKLHPDEPAAMNVIGLQEKVASKLRSPVLILLAAVAMVLLIACANYANLLLAKVAGRTHEMSVRAALGATRLRLLQQLVTESTVLSLLGGAVGIVLAAAVNRSLLMLKPESMVLFHAVLLDRTALFFALGVSVLTGLIFGLAPAFSVWKTRADLKSSGSAVTVRSPLRHALVVAELAVSIVLLVGAGLLIRSFWQVTKQDTGFEAARVLTMRFTLPVPKYKDIPPQQAFIAKVDEALKNIPGVESGGIVTELPLDGSRMQHNMIIQGHEDVKTGEEPEIEAHEITPDYFRTVGIRLLHGRTFDANDSADKPLIGIVNQALAKQYWPGEDPIGKKVRWARIDPPQWITIVGVAADTRDQSLEEDPQATVFTPMSQKQQPWKRWGAVVVRTHSENPMSVAAQVRQAVWSTDQQLPLTDVETMETVLSESLGERRFNMTLLGSFAGLALVLAVVGLYGVMSYVATQRTREVGIRMALGATSLDIVREFLTSALGMIAIGGVLGTLGAIAAVRMMSTMLFQVRPMDAITFGAVLTMLTGTALLATYIPARRAAKTDPAIALRHD
jgi:putative ABC transport system permease protein